MSYKASKATFCLKLYSLLLFADYTSRHDTRKAMMHFYLVLIALAIVGVALSATPDLPVSPTQYMVSDINQVMDTNAGYPPHYTEEDSAKYSDLALQKMRLDVKAASYGQKGSYSKIYDYSQTFPIDCGGLYDNMQVPKGYLIQGDSCCYSLLVSNCPYNPVSGEIPSAQTMSAGGMPTKIEYLGEVTGVDAIPAGKTADFWQSNIYLKQEIPVMSTDYYFDVSDHSTQLGNFVAITAGPQFINATTTYNGKWTIGAQDAELFDISAYDCSSPCKSSVSDEVKLTAKIHAAQH